MNALPPCLRTIVALPSLVCILAGLFVGGCDRKTPTPETPEAAAEPWSKLPPEQWPQMVLTNEAKFKGHTSLEGASSFLVRGGNDRIFAATALHLLGENGGVEPKVAPGELASVLSSWRMFPRTKQQSSVAIGGVGYKIPPRKNLDWLILTLSGTPDNLPATPLTFRRKPVVVGEQVFLVGVPYAEPDRVQNVYRGRVTARGFGDRFRYDIDPPVDIRGFSGAPIVDGNGLVVGVMTVWFEPKMQGEKYLEAGGEDAASVLEAMARVR